MGYSTSYSLKAEPWTDELTDYLGEHENASEAINPKTGETEEACKWYEHENDIREISRIFPNIHFTLHGEGEEAGDIWDKHFVDGKMQVCEAEIVIPPFDPNKLS